VQPFLVLDQTPRAAPFFIFAIFALAISSVVACRPSPEGATGRPAPLVSARPVATEPEFRPPRRIKDVPAVYPKALEGSGQHGDVALELRIGTAGKITGVEVKQSLGPAFDEAAVAAAWQWEYTPAIFKGEPALMYLTVFVHFDSRPARERAP
jgi:TonB family protein